MSLQISPIDFLEFLSSRSVSHFFGVPDSLLKNFCTALNSLPQENHVITANEGSALAMAIGTHLSTNSIPCVYFQNSGLGNLVNPYLSLASKYVYSIPCLLLCGWRGELLDDKQLTDEPQHVHQGLVTPQLFDLLGIKYMILSNSCPDWRLQLDALLSYSIESSSPVAVIVRKDTFSDLDSLSLSNSSFPSREDAIQLILETIGNDYPIFSTTGKSSRELFEYRTLNNSTIPDFLCVGGMGHVASIALGFLRTSSYKQVICLDGDGSVLMHMGSLFRCAQTSGFIHIMLNNGVHDSVGGQPTDSYSIDFSQLSLALGYNKYFSCRSLQEISTTLSSFPQSCSIFVEVFVSPGSRSNLGRPTHTPLQNKLNFTQFWSSNHAS